MDIETTQTTTTAQGGPQGDAGQRNHHPGSLFGSVQKRNLATDFLMPSASIRDALVRGFLLDDNELNDISRFYAWCLEYDDTEGMMLLQFKLDGTRAVKGRASNYATMNGTQIAVPEIMGASKTEQDAIRHENDRKERMRLREEQKEP